MSAKKSTNTAEETALEQWAASDEPTVRDDATVTGPTEEAREAMHQMLMGAASPDQKQDIERAAKGGRPRLSPGEGRSPVWRVRVPEPLDNDLQAAAEAEGRKLPEVLRDAAEEYLNHHHRASKESAQDIAAGLMPVGSLTRSVVRDAPTRGIAGLGIKRRFTTLGGKKRSGKTVYRSAITGKFVTGKIEQRAVKGINADA